LFLLLLLFIRICLSFIGVWKGERTYTQVHINYVGALRAVCRRRRRRRCRRTRAARIHSHTRTHTHAHARAMDTHTHTIARARHLADRRTRKRTRTRSRLTSEQTRTHAHARKRARTLDFLHSARPQPQQRPPMECVRFPRIFEWPPPRLRHRRMCVYRRVIVVVIPTYLFCIVMFLFVDFFFLLLLLLPVLLVSCRVWNITHWTLTRRRAYRQEIFSKASQFNNRIEYNKIINYIILYYIINTKTNRYLSPLGSLYCYHTIQYFVILQFCAERLMIIYFIIE